MAVARGTFLTGTGSTTVNITGLPFTPTWIVVWTMGRSTAGAGAGDWRQAIGFSDGLGNDFGVCSFRQDDQATTVTTRGQHITQSVLLPDVAGANNYDGEAELPSVTNGFNVVISNDFNVDTLFEFMCGDAADVAIDITQLPGATGTTSGFVSGLSFRPSLVMMGLMGRTAGDTAVQPNSTLSFGVATSASDQWVLLTSSRDGQATSIPERWSRSDRLYAATLATAPNSIRVVGGLASFESDGFELEVEEIAGTNPFCIWIAINDDNEKYVAGTFAEPTDTTPVPVPTPGVDPYAVLIGGVGMAAATDQTTIPDNQFSLGGATGAADRGVAYGSEDVGGTTEVFTASNALAVYGIGDLADGTIGLGDIDELGGGNEQFDFVMDTAEAGNDHDIFFLAFGNDAPRPLARNRARFATHLAT